MEAQTHISHFVKIKPQHKLMRQGAIRRRSKDTSNKNPDAYYDSDDETDYNKMELLYENDKDNAKNMDKMDSSSTFSSCSIDYSNEEPEQLSNQTDARLLNTIINILRDDSSPVKIGQDNNFFSYIPKEVTKVDNITSTMIKNPIRPQITIEDTEPKRKIPRMDWNNYHRLDVIHAFLDDLEYDYPSICTTGAIGKSVEGRDLKILKISNSDATNSSVWIDAGIHAREWIAPAVATYIANHIAKNFSNLPTSVTNKDWYFLPVVNPDGYEYSHTVDRMWRKSRARYRGEYVGVDLNRNFSCGWGGKGSSDVPTSVFYRGPEPFSEPESSAVRDMLMNAGISFKVYITLHSFGQVIIFPFAHKEELCPDYIRLLEGATVMSKAIYESTGSTYKVGISRDVMYRASGTSNDFSYGVAGIPYCYLIELRSKQHRFKLPQEEIEETGKEIVSAMEAFVDFFDSKKNCCKLQNTVADWNNE